MSIPESAQKMEQCLLGAKFTVKIKWVHLNQEVSTTTFVWDKECHVVETSYQHPRHIEWLCSMLLPQVGHSINF